MLQFFQDGSAASGLGSGQVSFSLRILHRRLGGEKHPQIESIVNALTGFRPKLNLPGGPLHVKLGISSSQTNLITSPVPIRQVKVPANPETLGPCFSCSTISMHVCSRPCTNKGTPFSKHHLDSR